MTEKRTAKEMVEGKKWCLNNYFGKTYKDYKNGNLCGDRRLFLNIYDQLIEALDEMSKIENSFIWDAFNESYQRETTLLDKIKDTRTAIEQSKED